MTRVGTELEGRLEGETNNIIAFVCTYACMEVIHYHKAKEKNTSILTKYLQDYTVHMYKKKLIKSVSKDTKKDETS